MIKPFTDCPKCRSGNLEVQFTIVMRETCHNCDFLTQRRVTPFVSGGRGMLEHLVDHLITNNGNLHALGAVLQQQLAKVQRREAEGDHRNPTGQPRREEKGQ